MKTMLITGSNSDVGIAMAKALIEYPVKLALHYIFKLIISLSIAKNPLCLYFSKTLRQNPVWANCCQLAISKG